MARPVDHQRRAQLLDAAVDYVLEHGLSDLSLRPLARDIGVTTTTLVPHFGSRDQLLGAIINSVRDRMLQAVDLPQAAEADPYALIHDAWEWMSSPKRERMYRLLFEIYGNALQHPETYGSFITHIVEDWLRIMTTAFQAAGDSHDTAVAKATLTIATGRGLLLDLLTSGDTERVNTAFTVFLDALGRPAPTAEAW